jgi:hypothetical protein
MADQYAEPRGNALRYLDAIQVNNHPGFQELVDRARAHVIALPQRGGMMQGYASMPDPGDVMGMLSEYINPDASDGVFS